MLTEGYVTYESLEGRVTDLSFKGPCNLPTVQLTQMLWGKTLGPRPHPNATLPLRVEGLLCVLRACCVVHLGGLCVDVPLC